VSPIRKGAWLLTLTLVWAASLAAESVAGYPGRAFSSDAVFQALERAYPGWVEVRHHLGGSTLAVGEQEFEWAGGRLLSLKKGGSWSTLSVHSFYEYTAKQPDVASWPQDRLAQAEAKLADRRSENLSRDPSFFDALWSIHDRASADSRQRKTRFLGMKVSVHQSLVNPLRKIEARLQAARERDDSLDRFLKTLARLEGYNWRDIAETQSRSNHAYGAALDLIPQRYGNTSPYWLWASQEKPGWYRVAWARRWLPHPTVIQAFEAEGFVWGGKWLMFDTIHFEYRPEILVLNGLR